MTQVPVHRNNFGAVRLFLASAVILSHSPEMLDGNRHREIFVALGSHITLGGLAVDGFFLISGYLVASSFLASRSLLLFMRSRILRIYPAFLVASLICLIAVGPVAGGSLQSLSEGVTPIGRMLLLEEPKMSGAFSTLPIPALDGSMWTIRYEFRCYLIIAALGAFGLLDRRKLVVGLTALCYLAAAIFVAIGPINIRPGLLHKFIFGVIGDPASISSLLAIFLSGTCAFLYREKLVFRRWALILSFGLLIAAVLFLHIPEIVIGTFGCYLLLWVCLGLASPWLEKLNNRYDFSYGVYLYAWPIASLVMLATKALHGAISPTMLTISTLILSLAAGAISWYAVEKPALRLKRARSQVREHKLA